MPTLTNEMMRQIIMEHYNTPSNKRKPDGDGYSKIHHKSDNCIDDIDVYAKVENGIVVDCLWDGIACAISTASTDILCDLARGKKIEEVEDLIDEFHHMMHEEEFDPDKLEEALAFINTSKQAARIRCATIGWNALEEILEKKK